MAGWPGYVIGVVVILVLIAPKQTLVPVVGIAWRYATTGLVALACLAGGAWQLGVAVTERDHLIGDGALALGGLCAAWWLYRLFVPVYRDQAPDSSASTDDR